jgi:hypothetical protein
VLVAADVDADVVADGVLADEVEADVVGLYAGFEPFEMVIVMVAPLACEPEEGDCFMTVPDE